MNLVIFILGVLVGGVLYYVFCERKKPSGTVIIDFTEAAESPITLKLSESVNSIYVKKHIMLDVEFRDDDSLN